MQPADNGGLSANSIDDHARKRRAEPLQPPQGAPQQAQLHRIQSQVALQQWEDGKDSLAVSVVEERYPPQHRDDVPPVARRIGREARGPGSRHPTILARSVSVVETADTSVMMGTWSFA